MKAAGRPILVGGALAGVDDLSLRLHPLSASRPTSRPMRIMQSHRGGVSARRMPATAAGARRVLGLAPRIRAHRDHHGGRVTSSRARGSPTAAQVLVGRSGPAYGVGVMVVMYYRRAAAVGGTAWPSARLRCRRSRVASTDGAHRRRARHHQLLGHDLRARDLVGLVSRPAARFLWPKDEGAGLVVVLPAHGDLGVAIVLRRRDDRQVLARLPLHLRRRCRPRCRRRPARRRSRRCTCLPTPSRRRPMRRTRCDRGPSPGGPAPQDRTRPGRPQAGRGPPPAAPSRTRRARKPSGRTARARESRPVAARASIRARTPAPPANRVTCTRATMSCAWTARAEMSMRALRIGPSRLIEPVSNAKRRPARSRSPRTSVAVPLISGLTIGPWIWRSVDHSVSRPAANHHDTPRRLHLEVELHGALPGRLCAGC